MKIDVHTHAAPQEGVLAVVNLTLQPGQCPPSPLPRWFSAGIHPWHANPDSFGELDLLVAHPNCLAVGEAGLDRLKGPQHGVQTEVFRSQVRLALRVGKPLIVHCVRMQSEVLSVLRHEALSTAVVVHGFNGKPEAAVRWLEAGCSLSFGAGLLHPNSVVHDALREVPAQRLFLETDDSGCSIHTIYARAAELLGLSEELLINRVALNFKTLFQTHE
ncbi:MAG: TatD family hydrolase [Bacteroidales bacterium]|nr:TatD family hydrolase [Bacteroidales bacterium]